MSREPISWHGGSKHVKGIRGVATMAGRISQQRDDLRYLEDGAGPAVRDEEG